jgi:hypothetical protein
MPDRLTEVDSWHVHIPFAFWIIDALRPGVLVELGTQKGDSYCAFTQAVDHLKLGTACYAISLYGEEMFETLRRYHGPRYDQFSRLIRSTSDDAAGYFQENTIDLIHIDGLHTYVAARHDFETWRPKLSARAVVLIHSTNVRDLDVGVWRLWNELTREYPSFTFRHGNGLGVLGVGKDIAGPIQQLINYDQTECERIRLFFSRLGGAIVAHARASAGQLTLAALESKYSDIERQNSEVGETLQRTRGELNDANQRLVAIQSLLTNSKERYAEVSETLRQTRLERDATNRQLQTLESRLRDKDRENTDLASQLVERAQQNSEVAAQAGHTRHDLERAEDENRVLLATTASVLLENETLKSRAQSQAKTSAILRSELHNLWNSWSWRLFRPLRSFVREWQGFGKETEPTFDSDAQVIQTIIRIRQSLSWEMTAPLRLLHRTFFRPPRSPRLHQSRLRSNKSSGP